MKKILILGSTGMLGHMVLKVLSQEKEWEVKGVHPNEFDAAGEVRLKANYDYIINCIGVLADGDEKQMKKVNAEFPHALARATNAKIIHMSTDGVFSGKTRNNAERLASTYRGTTRNLDGYYEDDPPDAEDAYGKSKLAGEVKAPNILNIRTSIIGPSPYKKKGLLEWFLSQSDGSIVKGYTNHVWNGVTTLQFAQLCEKIIRHDAFNALREESAVFHFAPNEPIAKYELLQLFKKVWQKNVEVQPTEDPHGPVERILATNYAGLKRLFPYGVKMGESLVQLKQYAEQTL